VKLGVWNVCSRGKGERKLVKFEAGSWRLLKAKACCGRLIEENSVEVGMEEGWNAFREALRLGAGDTQAWTKKHEIRFLRSLDFLEDMV